MAIQVGGTTVIDNSRVLSNVTGLKTVGGTSVLGSGNIATGGSTDHLAVGTYSLAANVSSIYWTAVGTQGGTVAGSTISPANPHQKTSNTAFSGTWRQMQGTHNTYTQGTAWGLFVRVS